MWFAFFDSHEFATATFVVAMHWQLLYCARHLDYPTPASNNTRLRDSAPPVTRHDCDNTNNQYCANRSIRSVDIAIET